MVIVCLTSGFTGVVSQTLLFFGMFARFLIIKFNLRKSSCEMMKMRLALGPKGLIAKHVLF